MAVSPEMILAPSGRLEVSAFQGETPDKVSERVEAYIAEGTAEVGAQIPDPDDADRAVIYWVYYRAYEAVHDILSGVPAQQTAQGISQRLFTRDQIQSWKDRSDKAKRAYDDLLAAQTAPVTAPPPLAPPTLSISTEVCWD